jgi:hypothetical protein
MDNNEQTVVTEQISTQSFIKYWFDWKFYILPVLLACVFLFTDLDKGLKIENVKPIFSFLAFIIAFRYKNIIWKKILMFFALSITLALAFTLIYIPGIELLGNKKSINLFNQDAKIYIDKFLKANDKLPIMLNDRMEFSKITSNSNNSIEQHYKFVNSTKKDIIALFVTEENLSKTLMQQGLKVACFNEETIYALSLGIFLTNKFYDSKNNQVAHYTFDYEKCKQFNKGL